MKRQFITCRDCHAVMAELFDGQDGRRKLRWSYGGPLAVMRDGEPTTVQINSQHFVVDVDEELQDCAESGIDMQCNCAAAGAPKSREVPLRATLNELGTRRSTAL